MVIPLKTNTHQVKIIFRIKQAKIDLPASQLTIPDTDVQLTMPGFMIR